MYYFIGLICVVVFAKTYEKLYEDEPWYEHLLFWTFALGLTFLWTFG
jgi:cytochrome bd-type quinol oxidase subunit 1